MTYPSRLPENRRKRYAANAKHHRAQASASYHRNKKLKGPTPGRHNLSSIDSAQHLADCEICGPVELKLSGGNWRCVNAIVEYAVSYNYGITGAEFREMLAEQGNACAICHTSFDEAKREVDHDHACCKGPKTCGKCLRKVLCARCNNVLGKVGDDIDLLLSMVEYLKGYKS